MAAEACTALASPATLVEAAVWAVLANVDDVTNTAHTAASTNASGDSNAVHAAAARQAALCLPNNLHYS